MKAMTRYEFDPMGRAHSYTADWDREIQAASLRRMAAEGRGTQRESRSIGVAARFARLSHAARHLALEVRLAHESV